MKKNERDTFGTAFFGTSKLATFVLDELEKTGIIPDVVVTVPDSRAGRGLERRIPEAKTWAVEREIPVIQPASLKGGDPAEDIFLNTNWRLFIVADYGNLIPKRMLDIPYAGTLNVHPSLLPKLRGPSPIISQILSDEKEVGVTIMLMDAEMDHGPIVAQASVAPDPWPLPASMLGEILMREGGKLLAEVIPRWSEESMKTSELYEMDDGGGSRRATTLGFSRTEYRQENLGVFFEDAPPKLVPEPQDHAKATYTKKVTKEDGLLDLSTDGYQNYLKYCAFDEWPGTFFFVEKKGAKRRVRITDAAYKDGAFVIKRVVPEGKKEMDYVDFLRGA